MQNIKTIRGCGASGKSLAPNTIYKVPEQVSDADAKILVSIGKAVFIADAPEAENKEKNIQESSSYRKKGK